MSLLPLWLIVVSPLWVLPLCCPLAPYLSLLLWAVPYSHGFGGGVGGKAGHADDAARGNDLRVGPAEGEDAPGRGEQAGQEGAACAMPSAEWLAWRGQLRGAGGLKSVGLCVPL